MKIVTKYQAIDGTQFDTEEECEQYENDLDFPDFYKELLLIEGGKLSLREVDFSEIATYMYHLFNMACSLAKDTGRDSSKISEWLDAAMWKSGYHGDRPTVEAP